MERKSSCFLPRYLITYKNPLGFIVKKRKVSASGEKFYLVVTVIVSPARTRILL